MQKTTTDNIDQLKNESGLVILESPESNYRKDKALIALAIVAGVVISASLGFYPILVSSLLGVVLMLWTGIFNPKRSLRRSEMGYHIHACGTACSWYSVSAN